MEKSERFMKLSEPFSQDTVQRTYKEDTRKVYDTTGIGYQFCVNRFNEIYGEEWGFTWEILLHDKGSYKSGQENHTITSKVSIWVGNKENARSCIGGHIAALYFDALKGAITNGFKKTAAFWGVGRQAYEGTLDDDNQAYPDNTDNKTIQSTQSTKNNAPAPAKAVPPASPKKPAVVREIEPPQITITEMLAINDQYEYDVGACKIISAISKSGSKGRFSVYQVKDSHNEAEVLMKGEKFPDFVPGVEVDFLGVIRSDKGKYWAQQAEISVDLSGEDKHDIPF